MFRHIAAAWFIQSTPSGLPSEPERVQPGKGGVMPASRRTIYVNGLFGWLGDIKRVEEAAFEIKGLE
jgi:hypothetical protein